MSLIERFSEILEDSRRESLKITPGNFDISEEINCEDPSSLQVKRGGDLKAQRSLT